MAGISLEVRKLAVPQELHYLVDIQEQYGPAIREFAERIGTPVLGMGINKNPQKLRINVGTQAAVDTLTKALVELTANSPLTPIKQYLEPAVAKLFIA